MNYSELLLVRVQAWKRSHPVALERRKVFLKELTFLYHLCVASEQLLYDAFNKCNEVLECPHFTTELASYYADHLEEEKGELATLIDDLKGGFIDVKELHPDPVAAALIGSQYYLIKHVHPVSLLGYMVIQEADPTPLDFVEKLEELHGPWLLRFIRMHAIRDPEHAIVLLDMIDEVPDRLRRHIDFSLDNALSLYGQR